MTYTSALYTVVPIGAIAGITGAIVHGGIAALQSKARLAAAAVLGALGAIMLHIVLTLLAGVAMVVSSERPQPEAIVGFTAGSILILALGTGVGLRLRRRDY